ncbi:hypothetical protein [Schaalia sp. Marseille-Q2122]|uniref:hypothetical protein n=1 Tax=Schaalia sp. Marseille-Q2122 TaxID=2736604 RepID=UPI00158A2FAB|nr:hypothetical protein [Schaalia sp. Marseille-Q2122]
MGFKSALMCAFGVLLISNWWFAMFSDSGAGQMARAMSKKAAHGKNFFSLGLPSAGIVFLLTGLLIFAGGSGVFGAFMITLNYLILTFFILMVLSFLPFSLPVWMYPEYHLARRERVRAERLARGEVVKMPSSGRVAVEAQRLEQIVREREAAQRADKDSSR